MTMRCPRCAKENEEGARFCSRCGIEMSSVDEPKVGAETQYCYRHPKRETQLSCGRCEKPVCTDCVVLGSAGPRCPDCAKSDVAFRPGAVVLGAKRQVRSLKRLGPWGIYIAVILGFALFGYLRGCNAQRQLPPDDAFIEEFEGDLE